jgi:hypothetical protein
MAIHRPFVRSAVGHFTIVVTDPVADTPSNRKASLAGASPEPTAGLEPATGRAADASVVGEPIA